MMLTEEDDSGTEIDFDVEWPEESDTVDLGFEGDGHIQITVCDEIKVEGN